MKRRKTLLRLGAYLMKHKWLLFLALLLTVASNLFALIGPMLSGYAIDAIEPGEAGVIFERVFYFASWMVGFYALVSILSYVLSVLMITISRKVVKQMRSDIFDKLLNLPVGYFDIHQTGDIISRISYDIDTVNESLSSDLIQILTTVITVIGAFAMMLMISPKLILVFVVTVPLSMVLTKYLTGKTRPLFSARSRKLGKLNGMVEELISGEKTLKAYNQEENTVEKFDVKNKEAIKAYYLAEYYGSVVGPVVNFINNLSLSLISVFGALIYLAGQGSLVAIVGHTGAGKTTLINLLMRFYDVGSGEITVDGQNIKNVTRRSLRKAYSMVLQDTWLFYGTIFENLSYGREGGSLQGRSD